MSTTTDVPQIDVGFGQIDPVVTEDHPDIDDGNRMTQVKEAATGRFRAAWGVVKGTPRSVKRGFLFAKNHPGVIWNQTRGVVLLAGSATFLFLMFNFIYAVSPIMAALTLGMSLGLLVITGQSAADQIKIRGLIKSQVPTV